MSAATSLSFERRPSALAYMLRGALPSRRRAGLAPLPEISARWSDHRADESSCKETIA